MTIPRTSYLYLAFRQAKTALFYERRGVGLLPLSWFEDDLSASLRELEGRLAGDAWFDNVRLGAVQVAPKRLEIPRTQDPSFVRIGGSSPSGEGALHVQLRLAPSPEFATVELLYLRMFGPFLDGLLGPEALGYRLDLRGGGFDSTRRWTFEYWPRRYQQYRNEPLREAKRALSKGKKAVTILSADLSSFYDTVDPGFLLNDSIAAQARERGSEFGAAYRTATRSLLGAYERYRASARRLLGVPMTTGIPIGSLTSRVVANASLSTLDAHIRQQPGVRCYRRYVDDLVVVATGDEPESLFAAVSRFLPIRPDPADEEPIELDNQRLDRPGSRFRLQKRKVKVHHLRGLPGEDFVASVQRDFNEVVSRSRSFIDPLALDLDDHGASHLTRTSEGQNSPLRVFREADRTRLERFALHSSLASLERASVLVGADEVKPIVQQTLAEVVRVLDTEENWVENLDIALRLLKLALATGDWGSAKSLNDQMENLFGTTEKLQACAAGVAFQGEALDASRVRVWRSLRDYLHDRRHEAVAMSLKRDAKPSEVRLGFPSGLTVRTHIHKGVALARRASELARADLRALDREDDRTGGELFAAADPSWGEDAIGPNPMLQRRFEVISEFVADCRERGHLAWAVPPARLFLSTRPPSYFDVARRMLWEVERNGFDEAIFEKVMDTVNALRGTKYVVPAGIRRSRDTVYIPWEDHSDEDTIVGGDGEDWAMVRFPSRDPRLVLGNLVGDLKEWEACATRVPGSSHGTPILTVERLLRIALVLAKTHSVARDARYLSPPRPTLLVLPELSVPRRWVREVAKYAVRFGRFGIVMGLEYAHHPSSAVVYNQALAVLPGPYSSVATWPWTKRRPAVGEKHKLAELSPSLKFAPPPTTGVPRLVVETDWGAFSVLICSELIEVQQVGQLLGRIELLLCPAWNPDTSSYNHLIQTVGFQLHAMVAIANIGQISDCRAWGPRRVRWQRDLCRLIERGVNDIVYVDLPVRDLVEFHDKDEVASSPFGGALDQESSKKKKKKEKNEKKPDWRPLPPHWPPREAK